MAYIFVLFTVVLLLVPVRVYGDTSSCLRSTDGTRNESNEWKDLLPANYSAQKPPSFQLEKNESVFIALQVMDIDEVNENDMYYQIQIFVISAWVDNRLETGHIHVDKSHVRLLLPDDAFHCFWSPSLIFDNSKDGKHFMLTIPNKMMAVYPNKTVLMASRFSVKVRCRFDLSRYPMDVQRCKFQMRLFDEPNNLVKLRWMEPDTSMNWITSRSVTFSENIKPTQFSFSQTKAWIKDKYWLNDNYTMAGINITFTRLRTSSVLTIYIPSTMIVFLSWISFWIDVQGIPGRVSLGIMSILTIITQILDIRKNMPPVSYVTAIDIWLFACLICVFLSLVEFALAYKYACHRKLVEREKRDIEEQRKVSAVNGITRMAWAPMTISHHPESPSVPTRQQTLKRILTRLNFSHALDMKLSISRLDDQSKICFPVLFLLFTTFYWTYYLLSSDIESPSDEVM